MPADSFAVTDPVAVLIGLGAVAELLAALASAIALVMTCGGYLLQALGILA